MIWLLNIKDAIRNPIVARYWETLRMRKIKLPDSSLDLIWGLRVIMKTTVKTNKPTMHAPSINLRLTIHFERLPSNSFSHLTSSSYRLYSFWLYNASLTAVFFAWLYVLLFPMDSSTDFNLVDKYSTEWDWTGGGGMMLGPPITVKSCAVFLVKKKQTRKKM